MCDLCEQRRFPLVQVLIKLLSGRFRWYSVCQECAATLEEEACYNQGTFSSLQ